MSLILLVEDNETNAEGLMRLLEKRGFRVTLSTTGEDGIKAYKELKPSLVLMDVSLPLMDGFEATLAIREYEQENSLPVIPVIAFTAHAMVADKMRAEEVGCTDFESKPVAINQLIKKINKYLTD